MFKIIATHPAYSPDGEEIDTADSKKEARFLIGEYQMAYGIGWTFKVTR